MKSLFTQWQRRLFEPVDSSSLGLFRFLFGGLLIVQSFCIFNAAFIRDNFVENYFHFPHPLFEWLHLTRLPAAETNLIFLVMGISAIGICTGLLFRLSSIIYLCAFSYVFLYEKSLYNAHYYLIILIGGWFCVNNADRWPSLPTFGRKNDRPWWIPYWQLWILQFQFLVVYFYGGLSKINADWLGYAEPVRRIIADKALLGHSLNNISMAYFISYAGIIFDLAIPFLLLKKQTRTLAFVLIVLFNLTNVWLFEGDIGLFPFMMIAALALFIDPSSPRMAAERFFREKKPEKTPDPAAPISCSAAHKTCLTTVILLYVFFQLIFPLRHWLYAGDVRWTHEGTRYAWFLKVNAKDVRLTVYAIDGATGKRINVNHHLYLTGTQQWLDNIPDMFYQLTQYLKKELVDSGIKDPHIYADCAASLNRRPFQPYLDPRTDFTTAKYSVFRHSPWIVPLEKNAGPRR